MAGTDTSIQMAELNKFYLPQHVRVPVDSDFARLLWFIFTFVLLLVFAHPNNLRISCDLSYLYLRISCDPSYLYLRISCDLSYLYLRISFYLSYLYL